MISTGGRLLRDAAGCPEGFVVASIATRLFGFSGPAASSDPAVLPTATMAAKATMIDRRQITRAVRLVFQCM